MLLPADLRRYARYHGFAADCGDRFIGRGLLAPIADARGGEDLDHVAISRSFAGAPDFSVIW